jgi:beta-glucosidase/6-phospho-beta-glucosidase/beta-galactosidase
MNISLNEGTPINFDGLSKKVAERRARKEREAFVAKAKSPLAEEKADKIAETLSKEVSGNIRAEAAAYNPPLSTEDFVAAMETELARVKAMEDKQKKGRWSRMLWSELEDVLKVMENGDEKWGKDTWMTKETCVFIDAAFRHLIAYAHGKKTDGEDGLPHLAHLVANALYIMRLDSKKI